MDTATAAPPADTTIYPFLIEVPRAELDDLRARLVRTRWPDEAPGAGWSQGVPLGFLKKLAAYWADGYDWRKQEARLNAIPQFTTFIDGANVHFLHLRSPEPEAMPLLLTHGWPGSVAEFLELIRPLTHPREYGGNPEDAFHVVCPSIPGFGFSGPTPQGGWGLKRISRAFAELMRRLGYSRYGAHGGDFGSMVSRELGLIDAEHVVGVHVLQAFSFPSGDAAELAALTEDDKARLGRLGRFESEQSAYAKLHGTRPQTLAYALTDSPVGQLAWNLELFASFGDCEGAVSPDHILTNVMLYWLTGTAGSAARMYYDSAREGAWGPATPSSTPTGVAVFPKDFLSIRRFAERDNTRIVQWTEFDRGGHYANLEVPELLLGDVRTFFRRFR